MEMKGSRAAGAGRAAKGARMVTTRERAVAARAIHNNNRRKPRAQNRDIKVGSNERIKPASATGIQKEAVGNTQKLHEVEEPFETVIEPFRIKVVEPLKRTTREERQEYLKWSHYNLFGIRSENVLFDFLTDSGTGAQSSQQLGAMMVGDESYAGARSWFNFKNAVQDLFPFKHILPTHQGRAAEKILYGEVCEVGDVVPNNTHFDTTRANIECLGAQAVNLLNPEGKIPGSLAPFKGNMDIEALQEFLESKENRSKVPCVVMTVTNNSSGGQPVSMSNIRECSEICRQYGIPFFLDGCRFAENAWFIKQREPGYAAVPIKSIVREMASYFDGMTMSAKKDGLVNIGGWLALNDDRLLSKCQERLILTEGYVTYGGLAGRDLEAIAQGLVEVVDEEYLKYRVRAVEYLGESLIKMGVPVVQPLGGHAVYIDAGAMLPHIPALEFPGHALACALYTEGGIRSCEIGSLMFGKAAGMELVRLAIPRRMYTQSHVDYCIEVVERVAKKASELKGYRIVEEPEALRHFTAKLEPIP